MPWVQSGLCSLRLIQKSQHYTSRCQPVSSSKDLPEWHSKKSALSCQHLQVECDSGDFECGDKLRQGRGDDVIIWPTLPWHSRAFVKSFRDQLRETTFLQSWQWLEPVIRMMIESGERVIICLHSVFYLLHIIETLNDDGETSALYEIQLIRSWEATGLLQSRFVTML